MRIVSLGVSIGVVGCFLLGACTDGDAGNGAADESLCGLLPPANGDDAACSPRIPYCWTSTWKPPKAPAPNACTEAQVIAEQTKCWGDAFDPDCEVFERDPSNRVCLGCLFSTVDDAAYGPVVIELNGSARANEPGCISILFDDGASNGCEAKMQAYDECLDAACVNECSTFDSYRACQKQAARVSCAYFSQYASCALNLRYDACTKYATFGDAFRAMARLFCISGALDGGAPSEAGIRDDAGFSADGEGDVGVPEADGD
jgi:hypothetical protein